MTKHYLVEIVGDIEPVLHGPYKTYRKRDEKARFIRSQDPEGRTGLFRLDIDREPIIRPYTNAEL